MKKFILIMLLSLPVTALAQSKIDAADFKQLHFFEDSLKYLGKQFISKPSEPERRNAGYTFIKTLVSALKTPGSFSYPFDSVKTVSIVNAPDNRFRILAWHILNGDGSYQYYGAIQMNTGGSLQLYPLEDYSASLKNPEDTVTDNHKWFGAQYYKIIQPDASTAYYTLLGWKGNTPLSTKKVIEVLSFANGKPVFGMPVFDGNNKTRKRVVFEYSAQAAMVLRYVPENRIIIFDHLSAPDPKTKDKPETYGPDMTFSGYKFKQGRWIFTDNLDMRNLAGKGDELLVDPKIKP